MNWATVRQQFPALERVTYFNTATIGQIPNRSRAAIDRHFDQRNEAPLGDFTVWFDDMDAIRASVGRLIGCQGEDIAFIQNASAAVSLTLGGMDWQPGDQILSQEGEFPNQLYYPAHLAAKGVELVMAPCGELLNHIGPRTRLVVLSTVSYSNGYRAPLQEIGEALRQRGILFYLDGTQSVGALRMDLRTVQPDVFAVHGYKWMLSPQGAGFMYVSRAMREKLQPAVIGWRSDRDWRSVNELNQGAPAFSEKAERYEGGMLNFSALYALGESVQMMLELGPGEIEARVLDLSAQVREVVEARGAQVQYVGSSIVAARFPRHEASAVAAHLKERGILVAARHGNVRISSHFYNNEEDIRHLAEALHQLA
jgi:cysteine desulfurase/selenocysteine lyase